ncbi:heparin lyase I family protein [Mesorhizobium comanense]|uniref:heparin lyase I family protein n=1 Tax=Mesorhizobium comanense TaxID=2502215 RepID=UPI0010FA0D7F|nr:heparin lyase I family protein [Mesorhizobium comanense]
MPFFATGQNEVFRIRNQETFFFMRIGTGILAPAIIGALLSASTPGRASAENAVGAFSPDLKELCAPDPHDPPAQWLISKQLSPDSWASRFSCDAPASSTILRISVHPGDAANPNPDDKPTERVEAQVRQEVVKFDQPTWYHFRFRLEAPWQGTDNRTVIHQVKQDIPYADQLPKGDCHAAIPLFAVQARRSPTGADFLARVHGAKDCNQGKSKTICGPWHVDVGTWNDVNVLLKPSLADGASEVRVWFNGRSCKPYFGILGYADHGARDGAGHPFIDTQPRFGIYRDALSDITQTIGFSDISFWSSAPTRDPAWSSIALPND